MRQLSLRVIFVILMFAGAIALGMIAYQVARPRPQPAAAPQVVSTAPEIATVKILVAERSLAPGMLGRDQDFIGVNVPRDKVGPLTLLDEPTIRANLRGALVQHFIEAGAPVSSNDLLTPRDHGFIAAVLAPNTRAVSLAVDPVSGVAGLIWPGDHVDVILAQDIQGTPGSARKSVTGETVLTNVRVIAVDQDIAQGVGAANGAAGRLASTVTIQATSTQAERLAVAERLGKLSLAIRASTDAAQDDQTAQLPTISGEDVSPALSRALGPSGPKMLVIQGDQHNEVTFR